MMQEQPSLSPRYSIAARKSIYQAIIAGDSDTRIQRRLRNAGFPAVPKAMLIRYRGRPFVLRAIAAREAAGLQEGFARCAERVRELSRSAQLLSRKLHITSADTASSIRTGSEPVAISRELRGVLAEIDAQVHRHETRCAIAEKRKPIREESAEVGGVLLLPDNGRVPDVPSASLTPAPVARE